MRYYKDVPGNVYVYNKHQTPATGLVEMTPEEVEEHINQPIEPQYKTQFSVLEFRDRFTIDEQLAIRQAQFNDMEVGLVYDNFQAAQFIDVEDQRVAQGIDLYIIKGLLDPERKSALMTPEQQ